MTTIKDYANIKIIGGEGMFQLILGTILFYLVNDFLKSTVTMVKQTDWKGAIVVTLLSYLEVMTKIGLYVTGYVLTCDILGNVVI